MCNFFSFATDETGKKYYFNWEQRQTLKNVESFDSHSSICKYYGVNEDKLNKYEYNPLTEKFIVDQINSSVDDRIKMERWAKRLNFANVVALLIVKPIVNPLTLPMVKRPTKTQIKFLEEWASVRASVGDSVGDSVRPSVRASVGLSVWASVRDSVGDSVWASVRPSVRASVWASVRDSVGDSVWASVGASVGDSVGDSVGAYASSFFDIQYPHNFSPAVKLWESGLVPSFDGKMWRLHSGPKAAIVYEWTPEAK